MTSKRNVLLTGLVAVILLVLANSRTWVQGTIQDAVLRNAHATAGGSTAAPVLVAAALVGAAAILAACTTGRVARLIAAVVALLSGVVALVSAIAAVRDPGAALRETATNMTGHTGDRQVAASLTFWPWVGVLGGVVLAIAGVLAVLGARSWRGLSDRYDAPSAAPTRKTSDWDLLSEGEDPTDSQTGSDTIDQAETATAHPREGADPHG